jgi:hypothetical protein
MVRVCNKNTEKPYFDLFEKEKKGLLNKALSPNRQSEESVKTLPSLLNEMGLLTFFFDS